jgi:hypothetical protein
MMQQMQDNIKEKDPDGLSPRILFLQVLDGIAYLRSKWLIILIAATILGIAGTIMTWLKKPLYKAEITFSIDEGDRSSGKSEFSVYSEQLGLGPVDGGSLFSTSKNIEELLKSRLLMEKTLRSSFQNGDSLITFADFFLDSLDFRQEWIKKSAFPDLAFNTTKKNKNELLFENGIISRMHKKLSSEYVKITQKSKGTSITSVTCITEHELFSKYFLEKLISEVTQYYIDAKTKRSKINLSIIEKRNDSVKKAYIASVFGRSAFTDADINVVRQTASAPVEKKQTDVQILRSAYVELSRNIETAKTSLMNETPLIDLIDTPILPLDRISSSALKNFIIYFIGGAFLSAVFLSLKRLFRKIIDPLEGASL